MKVLIVLIACVANIYGKVAPDYFPACKRSDPQINKCILDGIEAMRPYLEKGIPEVNIPPIEPFTVPTLKLDRNVPNLRLKATIKQAKAFGASNFKIEKLKLNLNNKYAAEVKVTLPKLMVIADYDVQGSRLLTLDINGKGRLKGNFTGITVVAKGVAKAIEKEGVEYLQAEKVITKVRINNAQVAVDDADRPLVGASTATFFNASPRIVLDVIGPLIDETSAAIAKKYINKILGSIPIKEVLIDDEPAAYVYPEEMKVTANISLPKLDVSADYVILGSFQMLPVESTGKLSANFTMCTAALVALGARVHKRMVIKDADVRLRCTGALNGRLDEAHSTTNEMEMITDHIMSMHTSEVLKEVQPAVETALSMVLEDVANKFLKHIPPEMIHFVTMWKVLCVIVLAKSSVAFQKSLINFGGFICPREEKALGRCLRDALNTYIPRLATGVPEYGVPSCEPLEVPSLSVQQSTGPISVMSSYTDVTVKGPSSMRVKDVKVHSKKHQVVVKIHIPELRMKGNYALYGQLLMLPIKGNGKFTAKYGDIDAIITITLGKQPRHNDVDALSCEDLDVRFNIGYASMQLDNLFGGDEELGKTMNMFLNDNWEKLADELKAPMEEALRDFLKPLADHAFGTLNADDIL
ncbi:uncharacterized protein LOC113517177 [Galleria mellonella]|uniref:Uncharacterized protein LOC113517177 n=1 Tax=Galleria mellonella TaxID=7137 RepID=A0ABM3MQW0_GALME|nr:uncharacterized protein LOC113517177 [Galleria mellonella]